jgi:cytochrome c oxidase cbb3-type subunit 3
MIKQSITNGRRGAMPAWGAVLGEEKVGQVAHFVKAMSTGGEDAEALAEGRRTYATFCVACHGPSGDGNPALGAPRLNDPIWLYGGSVENIAESIREGRSGVMPAHGELLTAERIQLIAAYVYSLSHPPTVSSSE